MAATLAIANNNVTRVAIILQAAAVGYVTIITVTMLSTQIYGEDGDGIWDEI
jgi:hypothetical protein